MQCGLELTSSLQYSWQDNYGVWPELTSSLQYSWQDNYGVWLNL